MADNFFKIHKGMNINPVPSAPSNPENGDVYYNSTDGKFYGYQASAWEELVGGGSGVGGINYFGDNYNFEDGTITGWTSYDDIGDAGVDSDGFKDGTGGSPTIVTMSNISSTDFRGAKIASFNKTGVNGKGEGYSLDMSIDSFDRGKSLYFRMEYLLEDTISLDDYKVIFYDVTNGIVLKKFSPSPTGTNKIYFTGRVPTNSNTATIRVCLHIATTTTATGQLKMDSLHFGPDSLVNGPVVTEWENFTPTSTWSTNVTHTGSMRRVGDTLQAEVKIVCSGAPDASNLIVNLPSGLTIDTNKMQSSALTDLLRGKASLSDSGTVYSGGVSYQNTTSVRVTALTVSGSNVNNWGSVSNTSPFTWASGDTVFIKFEVPIAEWVNSSAVLSTTEMMNQTIKAKMNLSGAQSIASGSFVKIGVDTISIDTANIADGASSRITANKSGYYFVSANVGFAANSTGDRGVAIALNGTVVAASIVKAADSFDTTVNVNTLLYMDKGDYLELQAIQGSGGNLNVQSATNNTWLEVIESPDFSVYSVYGENELVESIISTTTAWPGASGNFLDLDSITLTAGTWDLVAMMGIYNNGATSYTRVISGLSTASGAGTTGMTIGINCVDINALSNSSGVYNTAAIPSYTVTITADTTYYLKGFLGTSNTNAEYVSRISARRIA